MPKGKKKDGKKKDADDNLGTVLVQEEGSDKPKARKIQVGDTPDEPEQAHDLGWMYLVGNGVKKNEEEAARLFRVAVDKGHAVAMFSLATLYETGRGVKADPKEAFKLYKQAADLQVPQAQCNLASFYSTGKGDVVEEDPKEAVRLYKLASEKDLPEAQFALAMCLHKGHGCEVDAPAAFALYVKSAEKGYVEALCQVAFCHRYGFGTPMNRNEAVRLYGMVSEGNPNATATQTAQKALILLHKEQETFQKEMAAGSRCVFENCPHHIPLELKQPEIKLMQCAACRKVQYCSAECQKNDWKYKHKEICKLIQQEEKKVASKAQTKKGSEA